MKTPIIDYVREYCENNSLRLHMPGHKGVNRLGFEDRDITEINGADSLFEAKGIIRESEKNASELFGCNTFYSAEGSSLCIRAMLYLVTLGKKRPLILAGRNAHKTFITASALLDFEIEWLYPKENESYLSCNVTAKDVEKEITRLDKKPTALYLTSPDYMGNILNIKEISEVCKKYGVYLLVDNAHGAYLKFLSPSLHPVDLGADMCCDSAHKTLPCLTGGAYLHISHNNAYFSENAKEALSIFASTSPSYLIMQSLDFTNEYISKGYGEKLKACVESVEALKRFMTKKGYKVYANEPLKLTVLAKSYGYSGGELGEILENNNIFPEFYDNDFLVLMFTPEIEDFERIKNVFSSIPKREKINVSYPVFKKTQKATSPREALFSSKEKISIYDAKGRVLASPSVSCPPAVPIAICGEVIDENVIETFEYYGNYECYVVKK